MSPLQGLGGWWRARDRREQRMLAAMVALLTAFGYWYGVIVPLQHLRETTRGEYLQTVREVRSMAADLERIITLRRSATRPGDAASLRRIVLATAGEAGLAISRQREDGAAFEIGIDSTATAQVLAWLDLLRQRHGVAPQELQIERHNGDVRVRARFRI